MHDYRVAVIVVRMGGINNQTTLVSHLARLVAALPVSNAVTNQTKNCYPTLSTTPRNYPSEMETSYRPQRIENLARLAEIYNHAVRNTAATFDME